MEINKADGCLTTERAARSGKEAHKAGHAGHYASSIDIPRRRGGNSVNVDHEQSTALSPLQTPQLCGASLS